MPSPFPGVDPYIEAQGYWEEPVLLQVGRRRKVDPLLKDRFSGGDFHTHFVASACRRLNEILPEGYSAHDRGKPYLVEAPVPESPHIGRYVIVVGGQKPVESGKARAAKRAASGGITPVKLRLPSRYIEIVPLWIEIRRGSQQTPIALIESLTPTQKRGVGFGEYLLRRRRRIRQKVHLVELDLLLGGERLPTAEPLPSGDCYALVSRAEERPISDVYAWTLRDRLPMIPIPLRRPDPDVMLDLGAVFTVAYEHGRFADLIGYEAPPLTIEHAAERTAKAARR